MQLLPHLQQCHTLVVLQAVPHEDHFPFPRIQLFQTLLQKQMVLHFLVRRSGIWLGEHLLPFGFSVQLQHFVQAPQGHHGFYPTQKLLDLRSRHTVSGSFFCGDTLCQRFIVHAAVRFPIYGQLVHSVVQVHRDPDNGSAGNDFPLDCLPHVRPRISGKLVSGFRTEQPCRTEHAQLSRCPEVFQFQCKIRIPSAFPPCNRMNHTFILLQ